MVGSVDASDFIKAHQAEPEEVIEEPKGPSPFDFIKSVSNTKQDMLKDDPDTIKHYAAFIVNRGLGYFPDTVLIANEMNLYPEIPAESQYYYYMGAIRKGKRFAKWHKPTKDADIELIQNIYNVRLEVAKQYRKLNSDTDMKRLHELADTGEKPAKKRKTK
jgi:hypothetical protein